MNYVLPIANLEEPLSPVEIDMMPDANRIWASLAAAKGDLVYTEDDLEEHVKEAKEEQEEGARADAENSALSVVKSLELSIETDEHGEVIVVSNGIPANDFESDLQDLIMNEAQRLIDTIEWE